MFSVIFARRNLLLRRPEGRRAKVGPEAPRRPEVQAELHRRRGRAGRAGPREGRRPAGVRARRRAVRHLSLAELANLAKLAKFELAIFCRILAGSFSAVSKRMFARKHAFDSIFQDLQCRFAYFCTAAISKF